MALGCTLRGAFLLEVTMATLTEVPRSYEGYADRDELLRMEATYWTYRLMGEFPADTSSELKELVLRLCDE